MPERSTDALRHVASPLGVLTLVARDGALVKLGFGTHGQECDRDAPALVEAERQLAEYFAGTRRDFDLALHAEGTSFERAVWDAMLRIPYGKTRSYGDLAQELAGVARAVGTACGANPIAIVIPCHRIVGANGKLTGYSGGDGVRTKAWLLAHEGWRPPSVPEAQLSLFAPLP